MAELSIIIACRNDEETLANAISSLNDVVTHYSLHVETLVIDNESKDNTLQIAQGLMKKYPALHIRVLVRKNRRPGFGCIVRYGLAFANGRYCALVSSDGYDPVHLLPQFLQKLREGNKLVQGNRFNSKEDARNVRKSFRIYQTIYRIFTRLLLGLNLSDTTFGFRAFDRIYLLALGTSSGGFNICPEITFKVLLSGGEMAYIPGSPKLPQKGGSMKFQLSSEIWGYGFVLLRAALHKRLRLYWF